MYPYIVIPPHSSDLYHLPAHVIDTPIRVVYTQQGLFRAIEGSKRLRHFHNLNHHPLIKLVNIDDVITDHDIISRKGDPLTAGEILEICDKNPGKRTFYVFGANGRSGGNALNIYNLKYLDSITKTIDALK